MTVLLDTSAILAILQGEAGAGEARDALLDGCLSIVAVAEIATKLCEKGATRGAAEQSIALLGCRVLELDWPTAIDAGALRPTTKAAGLSLGDRICIETARRQGLPIVTADRAWAGLPGIDVRLIR